MTTMIADAPRTNSLGVGFDPKPSRAASAEAWKQQIGSKPIPARLALLPEAKPNWRRVGVSADFSDRPYWGFSFSFPCFIRKE